MLKKYHTFIKESKSHKDIERLCHEYEIYRYTINEDLSVDVRGSVDLLRCDLTKMPFQFGEVTGDFNCGHNILETLEGCPKRVGGSFAFGYNYIESLDWFPSQVGGDIYGSNNKLTSFEGLPSTLNGSLLLSHNDIKSFIGFPINFRKDTPLNLSMNPVEEMLFGDLSMIPLLNYWEVIDPDDMTVSYTRLCEAYEELHKEVPKREDVYLEMYTLID